MPYTTNPHLPRVRGEAVKLVRQGRGIRQVARYLGFHPSTISRWAKRGMDLRMNNIPTRSSRPHSHPRVLSRDIVDRIVALRLEHRRCSEVIHHLLAKEGTVVSLNSVKRVLKRAGLLKERSKWKKYHVSPKKPIAASPGDLVQIDTIHVHTFDGRRFYIYTLLDVHSRWAHAKVTTKITTGRTLRFLAEAKRKAPFSFKMLQTDHGPEFAKWFTKHAE